ncbi:MAG TPA: glycosyltransferase 87 family protein [Candidatus Baltobacterales bacterium]|nr:glycosyltransferase 87 family protein [Candidatus Baltobacterales bacterium]
MLLVAAGVPMAAAYLWRTALLPAITPALPEDFSVNYMSAAAKIAAGQNPYDLCAIQGCANVAPGFTLPLAGPQYVTPAPVAWMLQPLVGASPRVQLAVVILVLQLSLVVFVLTTFRALGVRDRQLAALLVLVAIGFEPVIGNFDEGQINLVLAALSGVWLLGWVAGDRWWGGAALGVSVALKLLQAPLALLLLWGRRWLTLAGAAVAGLFLWAVAVPQYLPEYLFKVAPVLAAGTGLFENHSPGGTVARLLAPGTFFGAVRDTPPLARVITAGISLVVVVITFWVLRRPRADRRGRALEAAAMVAAGPLVASYSWGTHLVLLLLPMFVLIAWSLPRRDWLVLGLVAASWLLIGPGHKLLQALLVSGYTNLLVLRLMAEFGVVGIIAIWVASLLAVRRERSADRLDPADE